MLINTSKISKLVSEKGSVYQHDGRADYFRYSQDGRADYSRFSHDGRADYIRYPHDVDRTIPGRRENSELMNDRDI